MSALQDVSMGEGGVTTLALPHHLFAASSIPIETHFYQFLSIARRLASAFMLGTRNLLLPLLLWFVAFVDAGAFYAVPKITVFRYLLIRHTIRLSSS